MKTITKVWCWLMVTCGIVLGMSSQVQAGVVWSAYFETPLYALGTLTGQQGWFHSGGGDAGEVVNAAGGHQQAAVGYNLYSQAVFSPSFSTDVGGSMSVLFTYCPGLGTTTNYISVTDNNGGLISVTFNDSDKHIWTGGTGTVDTGVNFTPGTYYDVSLIANQLNNKFAVTVNGTPVATDQAYTPFLAAKNFFVSGGGDATGNYNQSYFDNIVVAIPEPSSMVLWGLGLGTIMWRRRRSLAP